MTSPDIAVARSPRFSLIRNRAAVTSMLVLIGIVGVAVFAPLLAPYDPEATGFDSPLLGPSGQHLLGTDDLGRDVLSRTIYGLRASVQIGVLAVLSATVFGVVLGLLAGYYRRVDMVVSRVVDVTLAFPHLVTAVGLAAILGASGVNAAIAIAISQLPGMVRVARGETLRLREMDYVAAAAVSGARDSRILFRHIMPNAASALLVQISVSIPAAVMSEAMLSFLGVGVQPPAPSLGVMLSSGQSFLQVAWWMPVFPGIAIVLITLAFNLAGDALRDALDPRSVKR
ncbi:peptide/nickel transport system permease protein [Sinosporangium album]|uniref:Peptide/nickel transport system permease protein n=1 Tax=Sinosporangium album TaxID=504805 RepID=A0A1G8B1W8_9ACTN|nr:ABC transporter permease [Sinosporangium album]SDH27023.1 peptide/nickel transport system permease protein [Sinosporangium album]